MCLGVTDPGGFLEFAAHVGAGHDAGAAVEHYSEDGDEIEPVAGRVVV